MNNISCSSCSLHDNIVILYHIKKSHLGALKKVGPRAQKWINPALYGSYDATDRQTDRHRRQTYNIPLFASWVKKKGEIANC